MTVKRPLAQSFLARLLGRQLPAQFQSGNEPLARMLGGRGGSDPANSSGVASVQGPLSGLDKGMLAGFGMVPGFGLATGLTRAMDRFGIPGVIGPIAPAVQTPAFANTVAATRLAAAARGFGGPASASGRANSARASAAAGRATGRGGGAGAGGAEGGTGSDAGSCFALNTPIQMADGTVAPVQHIALGDATLGGVVTLTAMAISNDWYDYKGIEVTGSHAVRENGRWLRVESSSHATSIDIVQPSYTFNTSLHRIFINGIEFADFVEQDSDHPLEVEFYAESLMTLNEEAPSIRTFSVG